MTLSDFSSLPLDVQKKLEQAQQEDQIQAHQEQLDALKHIVALIEEVRRCWTPVHYRTAQQHLGGYIERVDSLAEEANSRRKRINKQLQCQPHRRHLPDSDTATRLEHDRQQAELERELYVRLGRQYRMIGDALAWQLYEFEALPPTFRSLGR